MATVAVSTTTSDVRLLRARCVGGVVAPGESGWDAARRAFNLAVDQRPAAVALPADEEDVAAVVKFARERGLRVAAQGTGHNAGPLGPLDDTLLVKTSALRGVTIDAAAGAARARAGVRWGEVAEHASVLGLAPLAGFSPTVGVVGYSLGGGMGWLARKHGLQANSVTAIELVLADGRQVRTDHHHEPELFWALRGGGGNFGVVTAIEFDLYPAPELYAGALFFPIDRARQVLHAWHEWTAGLPDELTSVGRIVRFPSLPFVPEPLRGGAFATVEAAFLGSAAGASELLQPLRDLGPALDGFATVAPAALNHLHMDPVRPVPLLSDQMLTGDLPAVAIDALVDAAGAESGSQLLSVELRHLGGALARPRPDAGALAALDASYSLFAVGVPLDATQAAAIGTQLERVSAALAHHRTGTYLNLAEQRTDLSRAFGPEVLSRLRSARANYDPEGLFRANHPVVVEDRREAALSGTRRRGAELRHSSRHRAKLTTLR